MNTAYDAIIVGARCAGSPTAMLLARKGYRVLVVDRATFPSDTVSTHVVHPLGVAALARWGLLDRLAATGCPPIHTYAFDFGPFTIVRGRRARRRRRSRTVRAGPCSTSCSSMRRPRPARRSERASPSRRSSSKTARRRHQGSFEGRRTRHRARRVVIGADGRHSLVAEAVRPEQYNERPPLLAAYYTYWSGLPMDGRFETYIRATPRIRRGADARRLDAHRRRMAVCGIRGQQEGHRGQLSEDVRSRARVRGARLRGAKREAPFAGAAVPNFFRKPYGPGWALVGDAGYNKDPITAQGITDAFRDAELLRHRAGPERSRGSAPVRRGDGRVPAHSRRARAADVRIHVPAGDAGAAAARDAAVVRRDPRQPGRRWTASCR